LLKKTEVEATAKIIDSLTPHQVLKLKPTASARDIDLAYEREKKFFDPKLYPDSEMNQMIQKIRAKIEESYSILADQSFEKIDCPEGAEFDSDMTTSIPNRPNWTASGPGEKFHELAQKSYSAKDYPSAFVNIQIALSAEPDNPRFIVLKERIEAELKKSKDLKK
jgi:hypothetical protein